MGNSKIPETIISNIGLIPEDGLQYGQLGNLIALFSISRNGNLVPSSVLRKHLIQIISRNTLDGSYTSGILGIMIGVLFLKINGFIEIDFDEIFYKQHDKLMRFSDSLDMSSETSRFNYLELLIYEYLLAKNDSESSLATDVFEETKIAEFYKLDDINDVDKLYSYSQLARRFILLHNLDAPFVTKKFVNEFLTCILESSKQNAVLSYDSDFLVDAFRYSKENKQDGILRLVTDCIEDYIRNIKFNSIHYKEVISSYNLLSVVKFAEAFKGAICCRIMDDMECRINDFGGLLCQNTKLEVLMGLRGGLSRHVIYKNDNLVYKEAILL